MAKEASTKGKMVASALRESVQTAASQAVQVRSALRTSVAGMCEDCRAVTAFQAWHSVDMTPSFNWMVDFGDWNLRPAGKRAVIELVTAQIIVPAG
jgi:roadblock/LC7 domain-containing protein